MRERGLKHRVGEKSPTHNFVAPHAGAWVETLTHAPLGGA